MSEREPKYLHTPGPWERSGTLVRTSLGDAVVRFVASCSAGDDYDHPEVRANADLIAAATAELEANGVLLLPLHVGMLVLHRNRGCRCTHCELVARAYVAVYEATRDRAYLDAVLEHDAAPEQGGSGPSGAHNPEQAGSTPAPATTTPESLA